MGFSGDLERSGPAMTNHSRCPQTSRRHARPISRPGSSTASAAIIVATVAFVVGLLGCCWGPTLAAAFVNHPTGVYKRFPINCANAACYNRFRPAPSAGCDNTYSGCLNDNGNTDLDILTDGNITPRNNDGDVLRMKARKGKDPGAYVWIDLGSSSYWIHHINLYFQDGKADELFDVYDKGGGIRAGTASPGYSALTLLSSYSTSGNDVTVTGDGKQARYVQISLPEDEKMKLSELEIYLDCQLGSYFSDLSAGTCSSCASAALTGKYCASAALHDCPIGRYGASVANMENLNCDGPCDAGYFCPAGSRSSQEEDCGAGNYCPTGTTSRLSITSGYYGTPVGSPTNYRDQQECEPGHFCASGLKSPCRAGRYGNASPGSTSECTATCPAGHYCPAGTVSPIPCGSAQVYCPAGSDAPLTVPAKKYSTPEGSDSDKRTGFSDCPAGSYCVGGVRVPCSAGRYGAAPNSDNVQCDGPCEPGYLCAGTGNTSPNAVRCGDTLSAPSSVFCPEGSAARQPVLAGYYSVGGTDEYTRTTQLQCEASYFCVDGVRARCAAGKYNPTPGLDKPCSLNCPAGSFCPDGSDPRKCGSPTLYCPAGVDAPSAVSDGYYSTPEGASGEERSGQQICPMGSYCLGGLRFDCSAGTYGNSLGGSLSSCSGQCEAGHYCPAGSVSKTQNRCGEGLVHPTSVFCPPGSPDKSFVTPGYYASGGSTAFTHSTEIGCEPGQFCKNGVRYPCSPGKWASDPFRTTNCTASCQEGYYCPSGATTGSTSPRERECGSPTLYCPAGSSFPQSVRRGYYSVPEEPGWPANRTGEVQCPMGTYCQAGFRYDCPGGRYGSKAGLFLSTCSGRCEEGYYCPEKSTSPKAHMCGEGLEYPANVYCPQGVAEPEAVPIGSYSANPVDLAFPEFTASTQLACPEGSYCINGTRHFCPAGRFGNTSSLVIPVCTGPCHAGFLCTDGSTSPRAAPCGSVAKYCPAGTPAARDVGAGNYSVGDSPTTGKAQLPCPLGKYCTGGEAFLCARGRYADVPGTVDQCTSLCAAGYSCPPGSTNATAVPCPAGYYCPEGEPQAPLPCPAGTYREDRFGQNFTDCTPCAAGRYSAALGAVSNGTCLQCVHPEDSSQGSVACWPGIVDVYAEDPEPLSPGISEGDTITITFSNPTSRPPVGEPADIERLLNFTSPLKDPTSTGRNYITGRWQADGTQLLLTLLDPRGVDLGGTSIGSLGVSIVQQPPGAGPSQGIRDAALLSSPAVSGTLFLNGTWGESGVPKFLSNGRGFEAVNTGGQPGVDRGDSLILRFNQRLRTFTVPLATKADVDRAFEFSVPIGSNYSGRWEVADGPGGIGEDYQAVIVVLEPFSYEPEYMAAVLPGNGLTVSVLAAAGLQAADGSDPSNDTTVLTAGSWGSVVCGLQSSVRSWRSARVTWLPPFSLLPDDVPSAYLVEWSQLPDFAPGTVTNVTVTTSAAAGGLTPSSLVTAYAFGLEPGTDYFFRVRVSQDQVAGEALWGPPKAVSDDPAYEACGCDAASLVCLFPDNPDYADTYVNGTSPETYFRPVEPEYPLVSAVRPSVPAFSTRGGEEFDIVGHNLGILVPDVRVVYAQQSPASAGFFLEASSCSIVTEHERLRCRAVPGVGAGYSVQVLVDGGASGWSFDSVSYAPPVIQSFSGDGSVNAATSGGQEVTIVGANFGTAEMNALGEVVYRAIGEPRASFSAADCTVVSDHDVLRCNTSVGVGGRIDWQVTVANQSSTTPSTSFAPPRITSLQLGALAYPVPSVYDGYNPIPEMTDEQLEDLGGLEAFGPDDRRLALLATEGGEEVLIRAINLGPESPDDFVNSVRLTNGDGSTLELRNCSVVEAHTLARCLTVAGVGRGFTMRVTVAGQVSEPSAQVLSYAPPAILTPSPARLGTQAGQVVTIPGYNLGSTAETAEVFLNGESLPLFSILPPGHRTIVFNTPDINGKLAATIKVVVGGRASSEVQIPIAGPVISRLTIYDVEGLDPETRAADPCVALIESMGSPDVDVVEVIGANFGNDFSHIGVGFAVGAAPALPCPLCSVDHTTVRCLSPVGRSTTATLRVSVTSRSPVTSEYSYQAIMRSPTIQDAGPVLVGPTAGGTLVTLTGVDFKDRGDVTMRQLSSGQVMTCQTPPYGQVGDPEAGLYWDPEGAVVRCQVPPGIGAGWSFEITARQTFGALTDPNKLWSYSPPVLTSVSPSTLPSSGGVLTLFGEEFGGPNVTSLANVSVTVEGRPCAPLDFTATTITCAAPVGMEATTTLVVTVGGQSVSAAGLFGYQPPRFAPDSPLSVNVSLSAGGDMLGITGESFGPPDSLRVLFYSTDPTAPGALPAFECGPVVHSHTFAACPIPEGGGAGLLVVLATPFQSSAQLFGTGADPPRFSYVPPTLSAIDVVPGSAPGNLLGASLGMHAPVDGGFTVRIQGQSLSTSPTVLVGGRSCPVSNHTHVWVECVAPAGFGANVPVVVTAFGQSSSVVMPPSGSESTAMEVEVEADLGSGAAAASAMPNGTDPATSTPVFYPVLSYSPPWVTGVSPPDVDAQVGTFITISGINFGLVVGGVAPPFEVWTGNQLCRGAVFQSATTIQCVTPPDSLVGPANVSLSVTNPYGYNSTSNVAALDFGCLEGSYGSLGSRCRVCPEGAFCAGKLQSPAATAGFFRTEDGSFVPCSPPEACLGEIGRDSSTFGQCSSEYTGPRCADCAPLHYRLDEICKPCPDLAWLYILAFVVVVLVAVGLAFVLQKRRINLAAVGIGIDFAQAVAMFAAFEFAWPVKLKPLLDTVSSSNFNLQLMAPECSLSFQFKQKWFVIASLPIVAALVTGAVALGLAMFGRARAWYFVKKGRRAPPLIELDALAGLLFSSLYYLYLQVVKNSLTIFDCTTNDAGLSLMDAEPAIECSMSDPQYRQLYPFAVASLLFYAVGIPALLGGFIFRFRSEIYKDQCLREQGLGVTAEGNPYLRYRKRFQRLYNDFKPKFMFWRLVLLARKFMLAGTSIMFNTHPMFQAAVSCAVMFFSYVLHTKYKPFLSRTALPKEFLELLENPQKGDLPPELAAKAAQNPSLAFVFSYNKLESTFLITATTILLCGMVFESSALSEGSASYWFLTVVVGILVVGSVFGFIFMLSLELYRSCKHASVTNAATEFVERRRLQGIGSSKARLEPGQPKKPSTLRKMMSAGWQSPRQLLNSPRSRRERHGNSPAPVRSRFSRQQKPLSSPSKRSSLSVPASVSSVAALGASPDMSHVTNPAFQPRRKSSGASSSSGDESHQTQSAEREALSCPKAPSSGPVGALFPSNKALTSRGADADAAAGAGAGAGVGTGAEASPTHPSSVMSGDLSDRVVRVRRQSTLGPSLRRSHTQSAPNPNPSAAASPPRPGLLVDGSGRLSSRRLEPLLPDSPDSFEPAGFRRNPLYAQPGTSGSPRPDVPGSIRSSSSPASRHTSKSRDPPSP